MSTILDEIIDYKRSFVAENRERIPLCTLEKQCEGSGTPLSLFEEFATDPVWQAPPVRIGGPLGVGGNPH